MLKTSAKIVEHIKRMPLDDSFLMNSSISAIVFSSVFTHNDMANLPTKAACSAEKRRFGG
ncbi:MAG: hypothetical protein RPR91_04675 [Colwellia sp.]